MPTLLAGVSGEGNDFAVVWTRPEAILPSFGRLLAAEDVDRDEVLTDVDRFVDLLERGVADVACVVVPTWTVAPWSAGGSLTEGRSGGVAWALNLANRRLMDAASDIANLFVLDAGRWVSGVGAEAYSERMWFLGKIPFDERVFELAADDILAPSRR